MTPPAGRRRERLGRDYPALRAPAYRRYLVALTTSEFGLYAFETTLFWTALQATGSVALVGILFAAIMVPMLVLTVPVGVLTDRFGPQRLMLVSSVAAASVVVVAALLAIDGLLTPEVAVGLAIAEGVFFGFWSVPAQVLAARVVEQRHVTSAMGLVALPSGLGSIMGGTLGGLVLELLGPRAAFGVAALGLTLSALVVATLPRPPGLENGGQRIGIRHVPEAFRFMLGSPPILALLALGSVTALFIMSRMAIYPSLAQDVLAAGPTALGLLIGASGVGSIIGALLSEPLGRRWGRGRVLIVGLAACGIALVALGLSESLVPSLILAAAVTVGLVFHQVTAVALLLILTSPRMRGRVLAAFDLTRLALVPVGGLLAGGLGDTFAIPAVLVAFGTLTLLAAVGAVVLSRATWELDVDADGEVVSGRLRDRDPGPT